MKILLLEDDNILASTLQKFLILEGYNVTLATNGEEVLEYTFNTKFDLYLFDINVPYISGLDLLKELRESGDKTPTFFISALIDINSISEAFDMGCDDYIKKPFDFDELLIRIKAILKKQYQIPKYKHIEYDLTNNIFKKHGTSLNLGNVEQSILKLLFTNIGNPVTKEQLYDVMENPSSVALRAQISRLKKLLEIDIINIRGVGYKLEKL